MLSTKSLGKIPKPDQLKSLVLGLSAFDIIFGGDEPVFYYERDWMNGVDAAFMDDGEGGQWSIRFAADGAILKGTHSQAFMFPKDEPPFKTQRTYRFTTYPGVLDGFPKSHEHLLLDFDPFDSLTFCIWCVEEQPEWKTGAIEWPESVDDPDASEELLECFADPVSFLVEMSRELYGARIADRTAIRHVLDCNVVSPALLKQLNAPKSLQSIENRLEELGVPVSYSAAGSEKSHAQSGAAGRDTTTGGNRSAASDRPDGSPAETALGALRDLGGMLRESGLDGVKDMAKDLASDSLASAITSISNVIAPDPPGSPMAKEPLFRWSRGAQTRLHLTGREVMNRRLNQIGANVAAEYDHIGREKAFQSFVRSMEENFYLVPDFLYKSFQELAKIYDERGFGSNAEVLRRKAGSWEKKWQEQGSVSSANKDLPQIQIAVPLGGGPFPINKLADKCIAVLVSNKVPGYQVTHGRGRYPFDDDREHAELTIDAPPKQLPRIQALIKPIVDAQKFPWGSYMIDEANVKHMLSS